MHQIIRHSISLFPLNLFRRALEEMFDAVLATAVRRAGGGAEIHVPAIKMQGVFC